MPAPDTAPSSCAITYAGNSETGKRLPTTKPTETAGLRWQPEIWPMAKAMVSTVSPKARATPAKPIPRPGKAAASTALPQPPKTSQDVPMNSAKSLFERGMFGSSYPTCRCFRQPKSIHAPSPGGAGDRKGEAASLEDALRPGSLVDLQGHVNGMRGAT